MIAESTIRARPDGRRPSFVGQVRARIHRVGGHRFGFWGAAVIALLAVVETLQAWIVPTFAPSDADWRAAASQVRAQFRAGDLIVAAPAWADPVMRMHLGDLLPISVAGRMDDARFGRIWEVSQRGGPRRVPDPQSTGRVVFEQRWGALTVRRIERVPAQVTFDVLERWQDARVTRRDRAGVVAACPWRVNRFACSDGSSVERALVEVDTRIRRALRAPPALASSTLVIEFAAVPAGRVLAIAAGLHDVWARKYATGTVRLQVFVAGVRVSDVEIGNRSGWAGVEIDTATHAGSLVPVRFEISSERPELRHFAMAAEARR